MKQKEFQILPLFFLVVLTWTLTSMGCSNKDGSPEPPSCGDGSTPLFPELPVALADMNVVEPLGHVNPPGHTFPSDHIYLIMGQSGNEGPSQVPVKIPSRVTALHISEKTYYDAETNELTSSDYSIGFDPCTKYQSYFHHVNTLTEEILALPRENEYEKDPYESGGTRHETSLWSIHETMEAGTPLGTVTNDWLTFDWGAYDQRSVNEIPTERLSPALDQGETYRYTVCPIHETPQEIQAQITYGASSSVMEEPNCGTIFQDVTGTLKGLWFRSDTPGAISTYPEDPHLAFLHNNIDNNEQLVSMGTSLSPADASATTFTPNTTGTINRNFEDVTPGDTTYCYSLVEWSNATKLLVKMIAEKEILAQGVASGECTESEEIDAEAATSFLRL